MMNNKVKIALAAAGVGIVGLVGIGRASFAQTAVQSPVAVLQLQKQAVEPATGDGDGETNDDAKEKQGSTKLQKLAKITPQQARQAAEASQGGKARSVKLENEGGNVVYSVMVGRTEVIVDAGNGRILSTENSQQKGKEGGEQNSPKSSIQSSADIGDGDGETNDDG